MIEFWENQKFEMSREHKSTQDAYLSLIKERNDYDDSISIIIKELTVASGCEIRISKVPFTSSLFDFEEEVFIKKYGMCIQNLDKENNTDIRANYCTELIGKEIFSILCLPLIFNETSVGCMTFMSKTQDNFLNTLKINSKDKILKRIYKYKKIISKIIFTSIHSSLNAESHKEIDDTKDRFLSTMSHELRTPLSGIVGMISMFRDAGELNKKQTEYLGILTECSYQLTNMLNNILDFSKMAAHRLVLLRQPLDLKKIIEDSIVIIEGKAMSKKIPIHTVLPDFIPTVMGDPHRLMQVITNILTNAVKFTDKGYIKLSLFLKQMQNNITKGGFNKKWNIIIEIEDTGIGIDPSESLTIFEAFYQSKNYGREDNYHIKKENQGSGMGLSIAKEISKLMNGNISVSSRGIGMGSTFSFSFTTEEEICIETMQTKYKELLNNSKILVVDDRHEMRLCITEILLKWKTSPTTVSSGEEALAYLNHGSNFDIALLDISMPYMSGIELAQEIRSKWKDMPLVGLSSIDITSGVELFDHYLVKPVDQSSLFPVVIDCLLKKTSSFSPSITTRPTYSSSSCVTKMPKKNKKLKKDLKILITEDDQVNAFTIREMLIYLGYLDENIVTVDNGKKCITEIKNNNYDVVFMDIIMPVMDGLDAIKHIRHMKNNPYVIVISAAVQNSDRQRCNQVGIDNFLTKPIMKEKLQASLSSLIQDN